MGSVNRFNTRRRLSKKSDPLFKKKHFLVFLKCFFVEFIWRLSVKSVTLPMKIKKIMGKFAGFWKRVKNFMFETVPNTIGKSMTNGIIKLNHVYKNMNLISMQVFI